MPTEITMPKLSDTMEEGTILKWRVQEGDRIDRGDIIAEVETDKAAMEMEAFEPGTVSELKVPEGETVPVGTVIAVLGGAQAEEKPAARESKKKESEKTEKRPETEKAEKQEKEKEKAPEKEPSPAEAEEKQKEPEEEKSAAPEKQKKEEPAAPKEPKKEERGDRPRLQQEDIAASPAARSLAREKRVDLSRVRGTGPGGRIVLADIERSVPAERERPGEREAPAPGRREDRPAAAGQKKPERSVKIRRIVARKMVESWQNAPHFFVTVAVDMTDLIRIRKSLGASINDFIVAAAARCLRDYPWVNSFWVDGEAVEQKQINISIAIATDRGLYNPVLRDCGGLSLKEIGRRAADLVDRAHAGRLAAEELEGGTFTISNMGMLGVESFSAIITPPQAAVLAVGTVRGEVVVNEKGEPGVATMVRLTLSADHRVLDGADAAEFLTGMKSYLEAPVTLITSDYGKE